MCFIRSEDEQNIRYILQNTKFLEKLHLSVGFLRRIVGSFPQCTHFEGFWFDVLYRSSVCSGVCEELEAMAGHNMLESLSF